MNYWNIKHYTVQVFEMILVLKWIILNISYVYSMYIDY